MLAVPDEPLVSPAATQYFGTRCWDLIDEWDKLGTADARADALPAAQRDWAWWATKNYEDNQR